MAEVDPEELYENDEEGVPEWEQDCVVAVAVAEGLTVREVADQEGVEE